MKTEQNLPVFYICPVCGNTVEMIFDSTRPLTCCGLEMKRLIPGSTDGAAEKHIPVCDFEDHKVLVKVGSIAHPMMEGHHIEWIEIVTDRGTQRKNISDNEEACACFHLGKNEKVQAVYAYCNLHGLWIARC